MKKCKTCVHHNAYNHLGVLGGYCECPKLTEDNSDRDFQPDSLVYSYPDDGYFWTGNKFGCVHHKKKEKTVEEEWI